MNKNIKLVIESLFDDDIFDLNNVEDDLMEQQDNNFKQIILNTLCKNSEYHRILPEDKEDGFLSILPDSENPETILYAGLINTYKTANLGPKKKKKFPRNTFYKYTIKFNTDGTISLYVKYSNDKVWCVINEQLYNFIEQCPYTINTIYFNTYSNILYDPFKKIFIPGNNWKISDKFIDNFPEDIQPHANEEIQYDLAQKTTMFKQNFSSETSFFTLIKKIIDLGYVVKDDKGVLYDKDNLDEITNDVLSGEQEKRANEQQSKELQFMRTMMANNDANAKARNKVLKLDYETKFNKIIEYYKNSGKTNVYFKTLNTFRNEDKINLINTVIQLKKDNNYWNPMDKTYKDGNFDYHLSRIILYKMFYIMNKENLNSYNCNVTLDDCLEGQSYQYSYYGGESIKYLDINDLPIKLESFSDLYKLYYVLAKAIVQCKDFRDFDYESYRDLKDKDIQKLNENVSVNLNTFNFDYLTNQLKTIIDKQIKKLKITE